MFQWLKRSLAKLRDYRDAGLDWHMRRLTAAIRRFSGLGSTPFEQVRWEDQLEWRSLNCPRQPPTLNDPWMPVGVAHILRNRDQPSELFFRDRLWARYEDVWRASDGVIDHTLAFASAGCAASVGRISRFGRAGSVMQCARSNPHRAVFLTNSLPQAGQQKASFLLFIDISEVPHQGRKPSCQSDPAISLHNV
jgi:hypothetical protein